MKGKIIAFLFLIISQAMDAQMVINEFSCSNINGPQDAFNRREDWVELYNNGATAVNLTGYFLSDNENDYQKFQIPACGAIAPGGRQMVYCSGRDLVHTVTNQIHPNFRLRQKDNEWFILSDPSGNLVDSVFLGGNPTQLNHSRGRTSDGAATWSIFSNPTPNSSNVNPSIGYSPRPVFSLTPGNYTAAQNVTLSAPAGYTIYYTTNGTTPSVASTVYSTPINVPNSMAIRAICVSSNPNELNSFIETNTYFINESSAFPVVSVCGPYTNATSLGGPYLFPAAQNIWSSFEYFDNTFNPILELEGRASKHGNDSWAYPQKGFDFEAMDETGTESAFKYPFIATTTRSKFDRIILKAGGSDNYAGGPANSTHIRDVFAQTLAEKYNLEMDYRRWQPVVLFINGSYYGLYDLRERVDADYFDHYYGKKRDEVDHLSYWGGLNIREGSDTGWVNLYNFIMNNPMTVQSNYDHVKDFLNIESFCQYFIINTYLVNHDWLNWNTMWWRSHDFNTNPVKWRYALWDMDAILDLDNPNYTGLSTTSWEFDPCEPTSLQLSNNVKHTKMLDKLLENPEFEQSYKTQWVYMFNTALDCQNILNHFDSVINVITPEMTRQANMWGGSMAGWQTNVQDARNFIVQRCAVITQKLDSCMDLNPQRLKLNVMPPGQGIIDLDGSVKSPYVWSEVIFGDSVYNLKATKTGNQYWSFDHWEFQNPGNSMNPGTASSSVQFDFKKADSVIAYFTYFNYDSVDMTFDVQPPFTGTVQLNGAILPYYPYTVKLDRQYTYDIKATPEPNHRFVDWTKGLATTNIANMSITDTRFNYTEKDIITAHFIYIPPPPPPPGIPEIVRDVFIPNAFSPNGDGNNDAFHIKIGPDVTGLDIKIFDRWGQEVFHTTEMREGWDGSYNGEPATLGVYTYLIYVKYRDHYQQEFKGDLTLIR